MEDLHRVAKTVQTVAQHAADWWPTRRSMFRFANFGTIHQDGEL